MIQDCPIRKAKNLCSLPGPGTGVVTRLQTTPVKVNGKTTVAVLDSGSTHTLVQPHLEEQPVELGKGQLRVCCVNGDEHVYPVADICLEVKGQAFLSNVGVVKGLNNPVVLGQDVLILPELIQSSKPVSMVLTHSQAKAQQKEMLEEVASRSLLETMPFSHTDIDLPEHVKPHKSRRQRRREKLLGSVQKMVEQLPVPEVDKVDMWRPPLTLGTCRRKMSP